MIEAGKPKFVSMPEDVTPAWLTDVLRFAGHGDAKVAGSEMKRVGTGQMGDTYRFALSYEAGNADAPASVVCKFPAVDPNSRKTGVETGIYLREVNFYREMAARIAVSTPKIYLADADEKTGDYIIVMEDLAPAEQGDQTKDMPLAQLELALDQAAKLHATFWNDDRLDDLPWLFNVRGAAKRMSADGPRLLWDTFRERYAEQIDADTVAVGEAFAPRARQFLQGYRGPRTLVHNDFRSDNIMFGTAQGGRPITILDWGSISYESPMKDVVTLLVAAISPEMRRKHERALLERYHANLRDYGVRDCAFDDLWRNYGRYGFYLMQKAFGAAVVVKRTPRGDAMFLGMFAKAVHHVIDHDAIAILNAEPQV